MTFEDNLKYSSLSVQVGRQIQVGPAHVVVPVLTFQITVVPVLTSQITVVPVPVPVLTFQVTNVSSVSKC